MRRLSGRALLHIGLIGWTALVIVPFALIVLLSFRNNSDIFLNGLGLGGEIRAENYTTAWNGADGSGAMSSYFANSVIAGATALVVSLASGVTGAYFAVHLRPRARSAYLRVFVIATVLPIVMHIVPLYQMFNVYGVLNQPVAVGVAYGAFALPTTVLVIHAFFSDFPKELLDAAAVDGLGAWRTYLQVVLPLSRGAITAVGILTLIFVWGETQLGVVLLQTPEAQTVPVGLLSFQGQFTTNLGAMFAGLALASIPIMLIYLAFNRQVAKGITLAGFGGR